MPLPDALRKFAERIPMLDARFFVTAVLTQRETGGNLAEVLDNLASVIRERFKVKRQVRVLSAHGRITGWVLVGPAAGARGRCSSSSIPAQMRMLVTDPLGLQMIIGGHRAAGHRHPGHPQNREHRVLTSCHPDS